MNIIGLLSLPDNSGTIVIIVIIAVVLIAVAVLLLKKRKTGRPRAEEDTGTGALSADQTDYLQEAVTVQKIKKPAAAPVPPRPAGTPAAAPAAANAVELIQGRADIAASLRSLAEKYSLDQVTLATSDGLVFASSGSETAQDDAAIFGGRPAGDPGTAVQGVQTFRLIHKGSGLVGIVRVKMPVKDRVLTEISADTKDILNWWI